MTDQLRYALEQMTKWVKPLGIVEIRRALACCAEESAKCEDGMALAKRLLERANAPEPAAEGEPGEAVEEASEPATNKKSSRKRPTADAPDSPPAAE